MMQIENARRGRDAAGRVPGLIGPNAVLQLESALVDHGGDGAAREVFLTAGHASLLKDRPTEMIDERVPASLYEALWTCQPDDAARRIAYDAGLKTGAYILQYRIPRIATVLLKSLPRRLAAQILLKAISKNAWTFAGSGTCRVRMDADAHVDIEHNPLAMPGCVWHVGVFEALFGALIGTGIDVRHSHAGEDDNVLCQFDISYDRSKRQGVCGDAGA